MCTANLRQTVSVGLVRRSTQQYKLAVGKRLRETMDERGMSANDISRESGGRLGVSQVGNYAQGIRLPGPQEAVILGKILDVPAAYLLLLDDDMHPLNKVERQLINDFRALPENERMSYVRRIGNLASTYKDPVADEVVERSLPRLPSPETVSGKK